eukprot:6487384-Amphidinium_carterae.1
MCQLQRACQCLREGIGAVVVCTCQSFSTSPSDIQNHKHYDLDSRSCLTLLSSSIARFATSRSLDRCSTATLARHTQGGKTDALQTFKLETGGNV